MECIRHERYKITLLIGIIVLIAIPMISGCSKDKGVDLENTVITSTINYSGEDWEIHRGLNDTTIYVVKNGRIESEESREELELNQIMVLPSVETSKDLDKSKAKGITHNTYESSLVASLEYVNYLKENEYTEEFKAITPLFYELYLKSSKSNMYKRLIITNDYIVDFNTEGINFEISDYII